MAWHRTFGTALITLKKHQWHCTQTPLKNTNGTALKHPSTQTPKHSSTQTPKHSNTQTPKHRQKTPKDTQKVKGKI